ncbi:MAG: FecR domain-containing protein [Deltaproteobacteria bacterium]|nr:FecR domain-containing protein [Deltaproteobacteria bacterium]
MKAWVINARWRRLALVVAMLTSGSLLLGADAKQRPTAGKVSFLKGQAERAEKADGPWSRIKRNDPVYVGDYLRTKDDSRLELTYRDKSTVRIAAASTMFIADARVDASKQERQVTTSIVAGKAWAKVSSAVGSDNKFEVRTDNAVAGVRGTTFRVNANEDKSTIIKVYAGAVAVSNAPFFEKKAADGSATQAGPIDFANRKPVSAPFQEVTKKQWEQLCGEWMAVKVAADGTMEPAYKFARADDLAEDKEWVAWNEGRDKHATK